MEVVRVRAILGHQQPAGKPRLDHVEASTSGSLRELAYLDKDISVGFALQRLTASEFAAERWRVHAQRKSGALYHCSHRRLVHAEHKWNPEHAFVSDKTDFEGRRLVDGHDQRDETRDRKVDVAKALPRRVQHIGEHKLDGLALGQHSAPVATWQRFQQAIDCRNALGRWHRWSPREPVKPARSARGELRAQSQYPMLLMHARSHLPCLARE